MLCCSSITSSLQLFNCSIACCVSIEVLLLASPTRYLVTIIISFKCASTQPYRCPAVVYCDRNALVSVAEVQLNPSQLPRRVWDPGIDGSVVLGRWSRRWSSHDKHAPSWCQVSIALHSAVNCVDDPLKAANSNSTSNVKVSIVDSNCYQVLEALIVNTVEVIETLNTLSTVDSKLTQITGHMCVCR